MIEQCQSLDVFLDQAARASAVEYRYKEADPEEPRQDDRAGCWSVYLQCSDGPQWVADALDRADAQAIRRKVASLLKIPAHGL